MLKKLVKDRDIKKKIPSETNSLAPNLVKSIFYINNFYNIGSYLTV
jgi:hypothetical protein